MKVVLREDLDNLGDRGQIVSVKPGYARNFLIPKGLALEATPGNLQQVEHQRRVWEAKRVKEVGEAQALADRIAKLSPTVERKAGDMGMLYGSVTTAEIAELLRAAGIVVDRRRIVLSKPIKHVGAYDVAVRLHRDVTAKFPLRVDPEGGRTTPTVPEGAEQPERDLDDEE